jgi:putative MATE family efflux protein
MTTALPIALASSATPARRSLPWARAKTILGLSAPIVLVAVAWNALGLASLAMVGRLSVAAVAGVGVAGGLYGVFLAVLNGLDAGVQALVARRIGAGDARAAGQTLNDALALSLMVGTPLMAALYALGPAAITLVAHDPAVAGQARAYLAALAPSLLILPATYAITAYWNGSGAPKFSLMVTVIEAPFAIGLTACLVFGLAGLPRLGVVGAGLGSTLSAVIGLCVHIALAARVVKVPGFLSRRPRLDGALAVARMGAPVSVQQSLLFLGLIVFIIIVSRLGPRALATGNVLNSVLLVPILAATGIGVASATLAGGALGRREADDARAWGWQAGWVAAAVVAPFSLVVLAAPRAVLGVFLHDPAAIALGVTPLRILALSMTVDAFGRVVGMTLRGVGATRTAAGVAFLIQWAVQLPLVWWVGLRLGIGLTGICASQLLISLATLVIYGTIWRGRSWDWTRRAGAV